MKYLHLIVIYNLMLLYHILISQCGPHSRRSVELRESFFSPNIFKMLPELRLI